MHATELNSPPLEHSIVIPKRALRVCDIDVQSQSDFLFSSCELMATHIVSLSLIFTQAFFIFKFSPPPPSTFHLMLALGARIRINATLFCA
jgi:hypothetical protein